MNRCYATVLAGPRFQRVQNIPYGGATVEQLLCQSMLPSPILALEFGVPVIGRLIESIHTTWQVTCPLMVLCAYIEVPASLPVLYILSLSARQVLALRLAQAIAISIDLIRGAGRVPWISRLFKSVETRRVL